jgi:dihydropyrimidinase
MSTLLIRNGTLVTDLHTYGADILINRDRIHDIAPNIPLEAADRVIDATNMLVMPGGIDVHTHLDMPFGGTTSAHGG